MLYAIAVFLYSDIFDSLLSLFNFTSIGYIEEDTITGIISGFKRRPAAGGRKAGGRRAPHAARARPPALVVYIAQGTRRTRG